MIKEIMRSTIAITILATGVSAADVMLDTEKLKEFKANNKALQKPMLTIKEGMDKESVYFLKIEKKFKKGTRIITAFVDKKTGAVYFGSGYDREGKKMAFPKDEKVIKEGISFSYGQGKKEIYLATDPECPYCVKFEKAAKGKLKDYTVHVLLYPLPYHKKAPAMVEWIMQGKTDVEKKERMEKVMLERSLEYKSLMPKGKKAFIYTPATKALLVKTKKAAAELGVRGTPATFDAAFEPMIRSNLLK